jgi:hypothetical protein
MCNVHADAPARAQQLDHGWNVPGVGGPENQTVTTKHS